MMASTICAVVDCGQPVRSRGWCSKHYARWKAHGDPLVTLRPLWGAGAAARFWAKVDAEGDCWQWIGGMKGKGYGAFDGGRAHRWAYEHLVGPIPVGMELDHLCRNRGCVNPDHLDPVDVKTNVLRGEGPPARNARKTHCPQGHPYAGDNLRISRRSTGKVFRQCRACERIKGTEAA